MTRSWGESGLGFVCRIVLFLVVSFSALAQEPRSTVVIERTGGLEFQLDATNSTVSCEPFDGTFTLIVPNSLFNGDRWYSLSRQQFSAMNLYVDQVNKAQCGVKIHNGTDFLNYRLLTKTIADDSSSAKVKHIGDLAESSQTQSGVVQPYGFVGPYSSGNTQMLSPITTNTMTTMIAPGAASQSVFEGFPYAFGTLMQGGTYLEPAFEFLGNSTGGMGAKNISYVYYSDAGFTRGVCGSVNNLAAENGMEVVYDTEFANNATAASPSLPKGFPLSAADFDNQTKVEEVAQALKELNPEVAVLCSYVDGCVKWVNALEKVNWMPYAQVAIVCIGLESFVNEVGERSAEYLMGVTPWSELLPSNDAYIGWNATKFAEEFKATTDSQLAYQGASAAGAISAWAQAVNGTSSTNSTEIKEWLNKTIITTMFGDLIFDANGQNTQKTSLLQYLKNSPIKAEIVYPPSKQTNKATYPVPSWLQRDCQSQTASTGFEPCVTIGNCLYDGTCNCTRPDFDPIGVGFNATCIYTPTTDYAYIGVPLRAVGYAFMAFIQLLCIVLAMWMCIYRRDRIIRASQPIFMMLVLTGVFIYAGAILPLSADDEWTGIKDGDQGWCMWRVWLESIGIVVIFGALFAKAWRINKIFENPSLRRVIITPKDVLWPLLVLGVIIVGLMLIFTLVPQCPYQWGTVKTVDVYNNVLTSSGSCEKQKHTGGMIAAVTIVQILALSLCCWQFYKSRKVSIDYSESKWISYAVLSTIQVIVIALPFEFMTLEPNAIFLVEFVKIVIVCLSILLFIFIPKIIYWRNEKWPRPAKEESDAHKLARATRKTLEARRLGAVRRPSSFNKSTASSYNVGATGRASERSE